VCGNVQQDVVGGFCYSLSAHQHSVIGCGGFQSSMARSALTLLDRSRRKDKTSVAMVMETQPYPRSLGHSGTHANWYF
jgi:hypothetical protein